MCVIVGQAGCHRGVIEAISAKIVRTLSMCTLLTWFVTAAGALDPHTLISQYGHTAWRAQDGFPSQIVSITQTTDGYIWIVAEDGESLFRFDGVRFVRWIPPDRRFPLHAVNSVLGARDGSLWIGASQGLVRWKDGQYTNYTTPESSAGINAILEDHTGKIWVTRYGMTVESGSLCWVNGSALECYGKKYGNPSRYGFGITEDSTGDLVRELRALPLASRLVQHLSRRANQESERSESPSSDRFAIRRYLGGDRRNWPEGRCSKIFKRQMVKLRCSRLRRPNGDGDHAVCR